jgi:hypothetical protein
MRQNNHQNSISNGNGNGNGNPKGLALRQGLTVLVSLNISILYLLFFI